MRMRLMRGGAAGLALLVSVCTIPGCSETPTFDPATQYTPESLAQELSFRFRDLSPSARRAGGVPKPAQPKKDRDAQLKSLTKEATKKAPAATLEELVEEIVDKARSVPGKSRAEVCKGMIEALSHDDTLSAGDRDLLRDKLQAYTQSP